MDSLRRGIPTTSSTNKQKFPEDAKSRIAQYLLENADSAEVVVIAANNNKKRKRMRKTKQNNKTKQNKGRVFWTHFRRQTVRANRRYHFLPHLF